jgi:hypothetical protein
VPLEFILHRHERGNLIAQCEFVHDCIVCVTNWASTARVFVVCTMIVLVAAIKKILLENVVKRRIAKMFWTYREINQWLIQFAGQAWLS